MVVLPRNYDLCSSFLTELLVCTMFPINCRNSRYYFSGPTYLGFNLCPSMSPILINISCLLEENFPLRLLGTKAYKCPCNGLRSEAHCEVVCQAALTSDVIYLDPPSLRTITSSILRTHCIFSLQRAFLRIQVPRKSRRSCHGESAL